MWPTSEKRAALKAEALAAGTTKPKPATKSPSSTKKGISKNVKLPKENKRSASTAWILPLKSVGRTFRGAATLGGRQVRSSPTFNRIVVDGQSYVLVPEDEHVPADTSKADAIVEKLKAVRNGLFEDGSQTFNLAGKQIGIAIDLFENGYAGEEELLEDFCGCGNCTAEG